MTFGAYPYGSSTFGGLISLLGTGSLNIISSPPGASIYIDDILQSGTTPSIITDIIEGSHNVKIIMPGFNDYVTPVIVEADVTTTIPTVILIPSEGCIYFTTNPPGASIYIDDILRAETTPALICGLTIGPHTYRLVLEGYLDITDNVDLVSGYGEIISQDLIQTTGNLQIISTPSGASIYIDNILQIGITTPNTITGILTGNHDIKITMDGFNDYTINVLIEAGLTTNISNAILTPNEGCLYFTTNPPGASIYIDDILRAETTPALICGLTIGPHTYRLVLEDYLDITGSVDLISGQGENISQDLVHMTGSLHIISTPPGASIYIDDVLQTGITTPDTITGINTGNRVITIRMISFNDYTTNVLVIVDTIIDLPEIILIPSEGCLYFTTNPPGASIYIDDILRAETTPALICGLTIGPHTYRLVLEDYLDITGSVDLISGHGETISQTFEQVVEAGFGGGGMLLIIGLGIGSLLMSKK